MQESNTLEAKFQPLGASLSQAGSLPESFLMAKVKSQASTAGRIFVTAIVLGLALRLVSVIWGDISPGGDGTERLSLAITWAVHPTWQGLSGVWPPFHFYFLGALIRIWNEPIILAKVVSLACGMGSIIAFRVAVRPNFGDKVASICSLLLAIFWTHIWLTSSYWVELPFILFVILAVQFANTTATTGQQRSAAASGFFLMMAILLRHEGLILLGLFVIWYAIKVRKAKPIAAFSILPVAMAAWHFIEPWLHGHSYFEYASFVRAAKAGENLVQGVTLKNCLEMWVLMPAGVPSLLVVIPGLYGLWHARRKAQTELFAWMFVAQLAFYFSMTLTSAWRPQLRYIMLYFVNLLPYAALGWSLIIDRFGERAGYRYVLPALVLATMLMQSLAWWYGRNDYRALGFLPLETLSSSQKALDEWTAGLSPALGKSDIVAILPGPVSEPWSLRHSVVVNQLYDKQIKTRSVYFPENPEILNGQLPDAIYQADAVLIYPRAIFYEPVLKALQAAHPQVEITSINPDLVALTFGNKPPVSSQ